MAAEIFCGGCNNFRDLSHHIDERMLLFAALIRYIQCRLDTNNIQQEETT